jgi:hypothetical protein
MRVISSCLLFGATTCPTNVTALTVALAIAAVASEKAKLQSPHPSTLPTPGVVGWDLHRPQAQALKMELF